MSSTGAPIQTPHPRNPKIDYLLLVSQEKPPKPLNLLVAQSSLLEEDARKVDSVNFWGGGVGVGVRGKNFVVRDPGGHHEMESLAYCRDQNYSGSGIMFPGINF